ncbi:MAG: hypothetical protein JWM33_3046 [Caulobacteraceae bacterium]|nr:hypothetical protein [Caulobacteraceae bacterium]
MLEGSGCTRYLTGMTDTPPDRLSANPNSPFHDEALLERGVGIMFNGVEKTNVDEYCVSEGWVRLSVGKTVNRKGEAMTIKLTGKVEPFFRDHEAS